MEIADFVANSLSESRDYISRAVQGLNSEEMSFRVKPACNSIAFLLWHLARVEDLWINRVIKSGKEIYEVESWFKKFGTPVQDNGIGYDIKKLDSWPLPALPLLEDYAAAVRLKTQDYLATLDEKTLDEARDMGPRKGTIGSALSHLITEVSEHAGQIGYIRGILKGIEPPPARK
jgi:uncharacterized damage-inducible protein DinB